ncbi:hypothetical protein OIN99_13885, partial [Staphylococcus aureus]|uniref:hypothetical protein n=1 Tax=Staphylococcus aureus TaxID=1280 RepID=UPI002AFFAB7C
FYFATEPVPIRSKSLYEAAEKTASFMICFCASANDEVFNSDITLLYIKRIKYTKQERMFSLLLLILLYNINKVNITNKASLKGQSL